MVLKVGVLGITGRMGCALQALCDEHPSYQLGTSWSPTQGKAEGHLKDVFSSNDVVIDFSVAEALPLYVPYALNAPKPFLIGTTGFQNDLGPLLEKLAAKMPVLWAPNTSLGVAIMRHMVSFAAKALGDSFDVSLIDRHHRHKKDAPSGTALALVEAVRAGCNSTADREVQVVSLRCGEITSEHELAFTRGSERLTIKHESLDRRALVAGALSLLEKLSHKVPDLYTVDDLLNV